MITFSHHRTSVKAIFNNLRILTLQQINTFQTGIFMYQHTKGKSPDACLHMFVQNSSIHNHYTRQHQNLHIIRCRTKIKQFSIKYHGVKFGTTFHHSLKITVIRCSKIISNCIYCHNDSSRTISSCVFFGGRGILFPFCVLFLCFFFSCKEDNLCTVLCN